MKKLIDLSHTIEDGLVTYKGLPAPIVCDFLTREASKQDYAEGTSFQIGTIELCANSGTYLDAPFHRYAEGLDIADLKLESVAGLNAVKVVIPNGTQIIDVHFFESVDFANEKIRAVLIQTDWSRHWNTESYYEGHPFLTESAALFLKNQGISLVGIDSYNIDDIRQNTRPVHSTLLGANILIVEHMCRMDLLPEDNFEFFAVPVKIKGLGSFPVRAFAVLNN